RRPDIRRAERRLASQSARVGVAEAELYPKFRLAGTIGLEAVNSGDFLKAGSAIWGFLPSMSWNVFDAGAIRNRIAAQSAVQEEYLLAYEAAVLSALEEVENNLTAYAQEQLRRQSLRQAVAAAKEAEVLSQDLYLAGLINFDSVLDAQRSLLSFQDQLAISEGTVTARLISLYKALGGGWGALPPAPPKPAP
ncbi:MAG: TolC family protein, partial [Proteobacteria bacterium]|nr:TolC family protein [Pseudomonadota bacterium]